MAPKIHAPLPWQAPSLDPAIGGALRAMHEGNAEPHQQKKLLEWLVNDLCETHGLSFRPDSDRATAFAEGKRFVGLQIIKQLNVTITGGNNG